MEIASFVIGVIALVLSIAGIIMAVPPLLQMLYGRPRLSMGVDEFTGPDGKSLLITIKNKRTECRLLRRVGVEREIGNVIAYFDIREQGTNKFIAKDVSGLLHCAPTRETGLLARALPSFTIGMEVIHIKEGDARIVDARSDELKPIGEGDYAVDAMIICGEPVHRITRNFKVGKAAHMTFWC